MERHVKPHDNQNQPIVDIDNPLVPNTFFNDVKLKKGQPFSYCLETHESVIVLASGTCDVTVQGIKYEKVGKRTGIFEGKPDSVYVPLGAEATVTCLTDSAEVFIAGGKYEKQLSPFRVTPEEVDIVQYGSDETKTHRKILHILGQNAEGKVGRLLVNELFTVGAGGWSDFPPHKHDENREGLETAHEEVYQYRFNPSHGFGAQFLYQKEDDFGPIFHIKNGSTIIVDKGYHPVVAAPGYEMYYFTILVGDNSRPLLQYFHPDQEYQVHTIPGLKDMIAKYK